MSFLSSPGQMNPSREVTQPSWIFLIGHRGVGKSSFLRRWRDWNQLNPLEGDSGAVFLDLDSEIASRSGRSVSEVFQSMSETEFRKLEVTTLAELRQKYAKASQVRVALGAGFDLRAVSFRPSDQLIWLRRSGDHRGRIFLDRPRLNSKVSPLQEWSERWSLREELYAQASHRVLDLSEGPSLPDEDLRQLWWQAELSQVSGSPDVQGAILTLSPDLHRRWERRDVPELHWSWKWIELRDDFLTPEQIQYWSHRLCSSGQKLMLSLRAQLANVVLAKQIQAATKQDLAVDLALELAPRPEDQARVWSGLADVRGLRILSLHRYGDSLVSSLDDLERSSQFAKQCCGSDPVHSKLAVEVSDFSELETALSWQRQKIDERSVLPRTRVGTDLHMEPRWTWFRLWQSPRQLLNFVKMGEAVASDQPSVHQWLCRRQDSQRFAAVLGNPVTHSWSPKTHHHFFSVMGMSFFSVPVPRSEAQIGLSLLSKWGLSAAAVTSPLKQDAAKWANELVGEAKTLASVNTLVCDSSRTTWYGHNTDLGALQTWLHPLTEGKKRVIVWGGGGVLSGLRKVLPHAHFVSRKVRTHFWDLVCQSVPRFLQRSWSQKCVRTFLVWAGSPDSEPPPLDSSIDGLSLEGLAAVWDLNYREDSRAKELALNLGVPYFSGERMFFLQAAEQQKIWKENL